MTDHRFTVTVGDCTREEAEQVMSERIGHDEDYGFTYTIEWEAVPVAPESDATYEIRRFHHRDDHPDHRKVIRTGLTLAEAQEHCQREDTHELDPDTGQVIWFDGYEKE